MRMRVNRPQGTSPAVRPLRAVPESDPDAARQEPLAVLQAAAAAVRAGAASNPGDAIHWDDAAPVLDWLVTAVAGAAEGKPAERGGPAANALGRHLLGLLRAEVVRGWRGSDEPPAMVEMFDLLEAIEQVRAVIVPAWSQDFAAQLAGPDGLELVVGLAHDLRSPLTSVLFLADTLGRGGAAM